ncbi:GNAT family acetyltransferase [Roseibium denhamense]|uniref:Acetyltransferase (GNAT) family protein n=1 Tax=Roseibium denhamense TaxID=76305 RepID=A0ABY1NQW6_9HYPH|nr:GNAT family acetyltransferase [Roseibium denhamense]MTI07903.1 GNAT family acetyltransferase [Roseibium denhamense]SMP14834.1 Acetyltransferase (GNAT) family protein [Roseibium denhamense]
MTEPAIIGVFEEGHRSAVIGLWTKCGLIRPWNDPHKDIDRCLSVPLSRLFILEQGTKVIGTVMTGYDGHRGAVYYLAVDPDAQKSGLGRQLMNHCEDYLTSLGCPKINLFVRSDSESVQAFYRTLGYEQETSAAYGKRLIPDT